MLVAAGLAAMPATAQGSQISASALRALKQTIDLGYTVSGVGLSLLSADFNISLNGSRYKAISLIKTEGIAGLINASRWDTVSEGRITTSGIKPASYRADIATRRGRGAVTVQWQGDQFKISALPGNKPERMRAVQKNLKTDMPDPLSALIATALFDARRPCRGSRQVFDGRTINQLTFKFERPVIMKGGQHYQGPAYRCQVKQTPIAGQPADVLAEEKRTPSPYHPVWLAPVKLGKGAPTVLIPVKITLSTDWGSTTVHLTRSTINGKPMPAAKLPGG